MSWCQPKTQNVEKTDTEKLNVHIRLSKNDEMLVSKIKNKSIQLQSINADYLFNIHKVRTHIIL
jgi:hypothetical protein